MVRVRPWLYVGRYRDTIDLELLRASQIGAMLLLAEDVRQPGIESLYLDVTDGEPLAEAHLRQGVAFVRQQKAADRVVMVACGAGISRSVSFAMAALVEEEHLSLIDAYRTIRSVHPLALPNPALLESLHAYYQPGEPFDPFWQAFGWGAEPNEDRPSMRILETERLRLRPLAMDDVDTLHRLADDPEIAANLADMPHPYPREAAVGLVQAMPALADQGTAFAFGLELKAGSGGDTLIGIVFLIVTPEHQRGELIYWLGRAYWGQGYATEAAKRALRFGFEALKLNRIHASYFTGNPASAHVLDKIGMKFEGVMREHLLKDGRFIDLGGFGILRADFQP